jgi:hypothetical protein
MCFDSVRVAAAFSELAATNCGRPCDPRPSPYIVNAERVSTESERLRIRPCPTLICNQKKSAFRAVQQRSMSCCSQVQRHRPEAQTPPSRPWRAHVVTKRKAMSVVWYWVVAFLQGLKWICHSRAWARQPKLGTATMGCPHTHLHRSFFVHHLSILLLFLPTCQIRLSRRDLAPKRPIPCQFLLYFLSLGPPHPNITLQDWLTSTVIALLPHWSSALYWTPPNILDPPAVLNRLSWSSLKLYICLRSP